MRTVIEATKGTITTDNIACSLILGCYIPEGEKDEFTGYSQEDLDQSVFFKYHDTWYDLSEFELINGLQDDYLKDWEGYIKTGYFAGTLLKFVDKKKEAVIVGHYIVS